MTWRRGLLVIAAAGLSLLSSQPAQSLPVTGVLTGSGNTWDPSAGTASNSRAVLAWTAYSGLTKPAAFLRLGSDPPLRLNPRGAGWAWSIAASTVAYQQAVRGNSNLRFYDWATEIRSGPGSSVNTPRWEYEPALSGHWLLFARLNWGATPDVRRVILDDLASGRQTVLATFRGSAQQGTIRSLQISGDWATWTSFSQRYLRSTVHRYQISTGHLTRVPHDAGWFDYLSAVDPTGALYFLRSRFGCGNRVSFIRYSASGVLTTLATMPSGRDGGDEMSAAPQSNGSVDLYFDSYRCDAHHVNGNVYLLTVPPPGGPVVAGRTNAATTASVPKRFPTAIERRLRVLEGGS